MVSNYVHDDMKVSLHSENGVLGVGPFPLSGLWRYSSGRLNISLCIALGRQDPELINAGKQTISYNPGASIVKSSESFALIRGRHIELTVLGNLVWNTFRVEFDPCSV